MLSYTSRAGGQFPQPLPVPHIIQGVSGTRFCTAIIIAETFMFINIFRQFSPFFARFLPFLAPWPHAASGTRSRKTEQGAATTKNPGWGGQKTTYQAGDWRQDSTAQGRGTTYRPPIPGAERRPAPEGGDPPREPGPDRAAPGPSRGRGGRQAREGSNRQQGSTAARAASGRGGPPQRGNALPAKKDGARAGRPPTAEAPRGFAARGKRAEVVAPPERGIRHRPNGTRPDRDGGARRRPAPRCRFVAAGRQRTVAGQHNVMTAQIRGSGNAAVRGRFSMRPSNTADRGIRPASGGLGR